MENNTNSYIKTDVNVFINEKHIRWVKKMNDYLEICNKSTGCRLGLDTHKVSKLISPDSYNKLDKLLN